MNCERCQTRPAVMHITEIVNNKKKTMSLCEQCAKEIKSEGLGLIPQMNLHNFLASFFNQMGTPLSTTLKENKKCPSCGLTEEWFTKSGLLGCGECYQHFGDRLEPVFRRIHGTSMHTGKVPERTGGKVKLSKKIDHLKLELKEVISREEFEEAAAIRDEIRELERELVKGEVDGGVH